MNKAIFLDRDGTINVEKHYLYKIEEFEFQPGVIDGLRLFQDTGYLLIVVTNQSGIGRGFYTESDFQKLNDWMLDELKKYGVDITHVYYCPHLPDAPLKKYRKQCSCRKPELGMFKQAILDYNIDLSKSFAIGDKIRDCEICRTTECHGFLIGNNEKEEIINKVKLNLVRNVSYCNSLYECALIITHSSNESNK